mgnify:CR=1 FL=1
MKSLLEKLFQREEGNILIFGLFLTFALIIFIIISYQVDVVYANKLTGMIISNIFVGRVPSLSFGYASNLPHLSVIAANALTEIIMVSYLYPLFIFSFNGILKIKILEDFFNNVKSKKELHQEKFNRYGKFWLFVFVFIPFWMTGPIVGSIIGFLIGMKHYTTILIVFIATIIAVTLWGFFLQEIIDFLLVFDAQIVWILLFVLVTALLIYRFKKNILGLFRK